MTTQPTVPSCCPAIRRRCLIPTVTRCRLNTRTRARAQSYSRSRCCSGRPPRRSCHQPTGQPTIQSCCLAIRHRYLIPTATRCHSSTGRRARARRRPRSRRCTGRPPRRSCHQPTGRPTSLNRRLRLRRQCQSRVSTRRHLSIGRRARARRRPRSRRCTGRPPRRWCHQPTGRPTYPNCLLLPRRRYLLPAATRHHPSTGTRERNQFALRARRRRPQQWCRRRTAILNSPTGLLSLRRRCRIRSGRSMWRLTPLRYRSVLRLRQRGGKQTGVLRESLESCRSWV